MPHEGRSSTLPDARAWSDGRGTSSAPTPAARLLLVDDEETIRLALCKFLRSRGYQVETAGSGADALEILRTAGPFALILCDVRMPGMSGTEVVPQALQLDRDLAILMLTAVNDAPTATEALGLGALDYLMKPIELPDLEEAVARGLHKRRLRIEQRQIEHMIRDEVAARTAELEAEKLALRDLSVGVIEALINAMEARDIYLRGRSHRVSELAVSIAAELGLDVNTVEAIRVAARIQDVGMIGLRESVLNKPGALEPAEFEHIKEHVRVGMEILRPLKHLGAALQYVQDHHERFDGTGYPRGIAGREISIGGRVLAAADAFDALTSRRAYREPMSPDQTVDYLATFAGTLLDPNIYDALVTVVRRRKSLVFIDTVDA
ncbi:MAG TPA: HD domain-containing phosphohydrolase [Gemmatimonadaceae bacterium]|nr:HD domain-containing phosphohydrolase [Gemmatimonadaceae bacterium]